MNRNEVDPLHIRVNTNTRLWVTSPRPAPRIPPIQPAERAAMIKFVLMVNKQGQTRLAQYYDFLSIQERVALEAEIIRKCLGRNENQVRACVGSLGDESA